MPPIHRMPAFYLAMAILGAGFACAWMVRPGHRAGTDPISGEPLTDSTARNAPPATPVVPAQKGEEPADGILRTTDGQRRKVLIREFGVVPRAEPTRGPAVDAELGLYSLWYLYAEEAGAFQVGTANRVIGWIHGDAALEWDSRLMARPVDDSLKMYDARSCALDDLAGRPCPRHPSADESVCPVVRLPEGSTGHDTPMGLPILRSESIPQAEGPPRTIFEVAALVADAAPAAPVRIDPADREALRDLYIVYVLDTTGSMARTIEGAKAFARDLADEASRRYEDLRLHLGLVEYRDDRNPGRPDGFEFDRRVTIPFVPPREFVDQLALVRSTDYPDRTVSEKVFAGLDEAIRGGTRPFSGRPRIEWPGGRAGELATKLVILVGDAPDHARGLAEAEALARDAREARITVASVAIRDPSGPTLVPEERMRHESQWAALAAGAYRPADPDAKYESPAAPLDFALDDARAIVPALRSLLDDGARRARELAELSRAAAEGRLEAYRNRQGLTMGQIAPILRDLSRQAIPAEDLERAGGTVRAPVVRRGWIAERDRGRRLVEVEMLLSRDELEILIADLIRLGQALLGGDTDRQELIRLLGASVGGDRGFLDRDRGTQTFADYLLSRGLPPPRPDSLLRRDQADLAAADRLLRRELSDAIREAVAVLDRRRRDPSWLTGPLVDGAMSWVPYAPIDL